ncbi:glycosyltransferase family 90 protein [Macrolepiota fuliginosa MF-IS2]|uniref:Glycosyltransferase family 90 protein n=1 Tax=Macrolepiota fuliginosa MF-IS2 TaxID=1400762 RepID=A0A9P5XJD6_9AGAR|nr:glycosyltransferase family 90 protein [Macrolepiota fuliginosa MF-IS2]
MFSLSPRRSVRRPVLLVVLLASLVFIAGLLRDSPGVPPRPAAATATATAAPPTATHSFRPDGLLEVNPQAPHPIYSLIERAQQQWSTKLDNASKSLKEAVAEYQRRYNRKPPLGFDAWWAYVQKHNVQLPDEYDQIYSDLEPFWGIHPRDLQAIQAEWEAHEDSYTLGKDTSDAPIDILNFTFGGDRPDEKVHLLNPGFEVIELLEDIQEYIPPFRAVFSPHDNPNLFTDWELRDMAVKAAAQGKYIDINNPPEVKLHGWLSACPPLSKAWTDPLPSVFHKSPPPPSQNLPEPTHTPKTFIHDHKLTMDPCHHPSLLTSHGQFLSHKTGPIPHSRLIPQFSYSPSALHHDITPAMPINWIGSVKDDVPWEDKVDSRLLWRGRNTGIWHEGKGTGVEGDGNGVPWSLAQRDRFVTFANTDFGEFVQVLSSEGEKEVPPKVKRYRKAQMFPSLFDVSFAAAPINCFEGDGTCAVLESRFEFRPHQSVRASLGYKYVMDVDGNGWSSRFKRLVTSNSMIVKATVYREWWLDRIQPWVHYVPVKNDYSDVVDVMVFFAGEPGGGKGGNEELAKEIARAGKEWSLGFWRREDLTAYWFRLLLEYARVMSEEREGMGFEYHGEVV